MINHRMKINYKKISETEPFQVLVSYLNEKSYDKFFLYLLDNPSTLIIDEKMFSFILRQIKPIMNKFFQSKNDPHVNHTLALKSLIFIIKKVEFTFEALLSYFTVNDIVRTFESLHSKNTEIVSFSKMVIQTMSMQFKDSSKIFFEIISNELILFKNLRFSNDIMLFYLKIVSQAILYSDTNAEIPQYYAQFILPILIDIPYSNIDLVSQLIETTCSRFPDCQRTTMKYFVKTFGGFGSTDQIKILELTGFVVKSYFYRGSKFSLDLDFSALMSHALQSENYLIVDTSIELLNNMSVQRFMEVNIKTVLPYLFDPLYKLSKKFWKQEQRCKAVQAIGQILKYDSKIFEECLINYNKKRYLFKRNEDSSFDDEKLFNNWAKNSNYRQY